MVRDSYWRLEHAFSSGPETATPIDGHAGPESAVANGSGYTLTVWLTGESDSPAGAWPDAPERWETLLGIAGPASATFVYNTPGDGPKAYGVDGATAGVGGGLVTLYPPATGPSSEYGRGGHFACTSVEDTATLPERLAPLEMELTRVADIGTGPGAYPDRAAARAALETPGI